MESMELLAGQLNSLISTSFAIPCELAHYSIVITGVKRSWGDHAATQPFATWLFSLICCFGGGTLVNLLCGQPALNSFTNTQSLVLASLVWWLVFYSPSNFYSKLMRFQLINIALLLLKEMIRTRKIMKGVAIARAAYPSSLFVCTAMGMLSACGGGFIKAIALSLASSWSKESIKEVYFSPVTKACLCFSLLYNLQLQSYISLTANAVSLIQITFIYAITISSFYGYFADPFQPVENLLSGLFINYSYISAQSELISNQEDKQKIKEKVKSGRQKKAD